MDKLKRMILKAQKTRRQDEKYIAWATVHPKGDEYEAHIMYFANNEADAKAADVLTFKTRDAAADYVGALAEEHGQQETLILHFNF